MTNLAVVADAVDLPDQWDAPFDLWDAAIAAPPLERGIFPKKIDEFLFSAEDTHNPLALAVSVMFAASIIIGDRRYVKIVNGWHENLIFWMSIYGSSAVGKSPAMKRALSVITLMQSANHAEYLRELAAWDAAGRDPATKPEFIPFYTSDGTVEALSNEMANHTFGVGLFADELSDFISRFANNPKEAMANSGAWLTAHTGGPIFINRVGRGRVFCPNFAINILGAITTDKLLSVVRKMSADGFSARMIYTHVPDIAPVPLKETSQKLLDDYGTLIVQLGELRNHAVQPLMFDKAAQVKFSEQMILYKTRAGIHKDHSPRLAEWEGKLPGLLARIAGLLYMLEGGGEPYVIRLPTLTRAIKLADIFAAQARVFFDNLAGAPDGAEIAVARAIGNYILRSGAEVLQVGDITRHVTEWRGGGTTRAVKITALEMLDNLGWIRTDNAYDWVSGGQIVKGAKFQVNPEVHELYKRRADEIKRFAEEAVENIKKSAALRREEQGI